MKERFVRECCDAFGNWLALAVSRNARLADDFNEGPDGFRRKSIPSELLRHFKFGCIGGLLQNRLLEHACAEIGSETCVDVGHVYAALMTAIRALERDGSLSQSVLSDAATVGSDYGIGSRIVLVDNAQMSDRVIPAGVRGTIVGPVNASDSLVDCKLDGFEGTMEIGKSRVRIEVDTSQSSAQAATPSNDTVDSVQETPAKARAMAIMRVFIAIVRADRVIDDREKRMLRNFASKVGISREEVQALAAEKAVVNVADLPSDAAERRSLLTDAFSLALADGTLAKSERAIIDRVAATLGMGSDQVDQCMQAASKQLSELGGVQKVARAKQHAGSAVSVATMSSHEFESETMSWSGLGEFVLGVTELDTAKARFPRAEISTFEGGFVRAPKQGVRIRDAETGLILRFLEVTPGDPRLDDVTVQAPWAGQTIDGVGIGQSATAIRKIAEKYSLDKYSYGIMSKSVGSLTSGVFLKRSVESSARQRVQVQMMFGFAEEVPLQLRDLPTCPDVPISSIAIEISR